MLCASTCREDRAVRQLSASVEPKQGCMPADQLNCPMCFACEQFNPSVYALLRNLEHSPGVIYEREPFCFIAFLHAVAPDMAARAVMSVCLRARGQALSIVICQLPCNQLHGRPLRGYEPAADYKTKSSNVLGMLLVRLSISKRFWRMLSIRI